MDDYGRRISDSGQPQSANASCNHDFAAVASRHGVVVFDLNTQRGKPLQIESDHAGSKGPSTPLAFSPLRSKALALGYGSEILVFDVATNERLQSINGGGRTITAIAWSFHDSNVFATGTAHGKICLWNVEHSRKPVQQFGGSKALCNAIAFSPTDSKLLAASHGDQIRIWILSPNAHLATTIVSDGTDFAAQAWHPLDEARLLTTTKAGLLVVYDCSQLISDTRNILLELERNVDYDDGNVAKLLDSPGEAKIQLQHHLAGGICTAKWIREHGILLLNAARASASLLIRHGEELELRWSRNLGADTQCLHLAETAHTAGLMAISLNHFETFSLADKILEGMGPKKVTSIPLRPMSSISTTSMHSGHSSGKKLKRHTVCSHKMKPATIEATSTGGSVTQATKPSQDKHLPIQSIRGIRDFQRTQSLRMPIQTESRSVLLDRESAVVTEEDKSSPKSLAPKNRSSRRSSRRTSMNSFRSIEKPLVLSRLPPLSSFDSSLQSTDTGQESDSDDETFVAALGGSQTLAPGGVHVPLPKACGALFGPSGHLLTYFPPRARLPSALPEQINPSIPVKEEDKAVKITRIFPKFGDLLSGNTKRGTNSDSEDDSDSMGESTLLIDASNALQTTSLQSQHAWNPANLPMKAPWGKPSDQRVIINVSTMPDVAALLPDQYSLASQYRILCEPHETGSQVCGHNEEVARAIGQTDAANVWGLLGLLLEDNVPLDIIRISLESNDALVLNRQPKALSRRDSAVDLAEARRMHDRRGKFRWNKHPFGGVWAVRKILAWAEQKGDAQMLACMCAVLAQTEASKVTADLRSINALTAKIPATSLEYVTAPSMLSHATVEKPDSVLRIDASTSVISVDNSPVKFGRSDSGNNSRSHSQPVTPRWDSPGSTPSAFAWPTLSRQSTRLSATSGTSGTAPLPSSASPELARGSFSAAAKYYAQSISDKFADKLSLYGTSPPILRSNMSKTGSSPRNPDQLSSSLPRGSLSKSVSFASTTNSVGAGRLSRSYEAQQDSPQMVDIDEEYESDRTIARGSAMTALSPRTVKSGISVILKNQESFVDEMSGGAEAPLIPADLKIKAQIWMDFYAELLRTWGLWSLATDMDKVASITSGLPAAIVKEEHHSPGVIVCQASSTSSPFNSSLESDHSSKSPSLLCAICLTTERRIQQTCPACLHTSHLHCLELYAAALNPTVMGTGTSPSSTIDPDAVAFTCPTGCGCACADLPGVAESPAAESLAARSGWLRDESARPSSVRTVVKKPSFTDPRRWRARVEGDSW